MSIIRSFIRILFASLLLVFPTCTPRSVREAKSIVHQADTLWHDGRMYGREDGDSARIVRAYQTLDRWQWLDADNYAHACYHYGRLLREREDHVSAMQVFINATHSNTHDKDLRGRVFTNMAVMCRLEGNHPLAYEMFDRSREQFEQNNDTTAYFYALNSMAFELAEQARKADCLSLLNQIEQNCTNRDVRIKTLETMAEVYFMVQEYDSAIYFANLLQQYGNSEPTGFLIKAQSYSCLNRKDSAVYYASMVAEQSASLFDLNNSLYILANDNADADMDDIQHIHASRSDVQKSIELRRSKLSHAVELLQQDLDKKPNYIGLIVFVIATLLVAAMLWYAYRKMRHLSKQQSRIKQQRSEYQQAQLAEIEHLCEALRLSHDIKKELQWSNYDQMCEIINKHFNFLANKLKATNLLTQTEIKLCVLVLINFRFNQMAEILPYAQNSIGKLKDTAAKHLGTTGKLLRKTLLEMVIGGH